MLFKSNRIPEVPSAVLCARLGAVCREWRELMRKERRWMCVNLTAEKAFTQHFRQRRGTRVRWGAGYDSLGLTEYKAVYIREMDYGDWLRVAPSRGLRRRGDNVFVDTFRVSLGDLRQDTAGILHRRLRATMLSHNAIVGVRSVRTTAAMLAEGGSENVLRWLRSFGRAVVECMARRVSGRLCLVFPVPRRVDDVKIMMTVVSFVRQFSGAHPTTISGVALHMRGPGYRRRAFRGEALACGETGLTTTFREVLYAMQGSQRGGGMRLILSLYSPTFVSLFGEVEPNGDPTEN